MGLFEKAKEKAREKALQALQPKQKTTTGPVAATPLLDVSMWAVPPTKGVVKFHHDKLGKMYLYHPELMPGVVPGQKIVLEAFPGDCRIISTYNHSEIDTREGVIAWCFRGNVVGMSSYGAEMARMLIFQGYRVTADAEADGWFAPGMLDLFIWVGRGRDCYDVVGR